MPGFEVTEQQGSAAKGVQRANRSPRQQGVVSQKLANGKVSRTTHSCLPSDVYSCSVQVAALSA